MTHELHLGSVVPDNPKNRGHALKAEELEDSEPDEEEAATLVRRMKRLYRNLRPGNKKGRNSGRRTVGSKSDQGCFRCGDPDPQIRECPQWEYEKGKGKDQLKERFNKPTFSKPKKAMIATWGDVTDSEDDDDQPEKETANLCLMAKIDGTMQDPSNEEQAENQGVPMQEEQVENNLEVHVQEEQANQEVPIREEQAENTGVSVQEEQEEQGTPRSRGSRGTQGVQRTEEIEETLDVPMVQIQPKPWKLQSSHRMELIVSNIVRRIQTRSQLRSFCTFQSFLSIIKPNNQKGIGLK
ncbi:uncharacterized protein [Spinacia oleracea]|uniref:CCHC-type domain-containing protein n=1 Tax=Spinacia oleracea TaxID=3562 RepID=A0ABM3RR76_SPIOL|nr:uncharacterized protein LOC110791959 [Spinacia oleracea]